MATLPDRSVINRQIAEGWNAEAPPALTSIYTEGWESNLLTMGTFTISTSAVEITVGETVTFTGTSLRGDGLPAETDVEVDRPDGVIETISATVNSDGSFIAEYTAEVPGEHSARGLNRVAGSRGVEPWDAVSPPGGTREISEDWEEA